MNLNILIVNDKLNIIENLINTLNKDYYVELINGEVFSNNITKCKEFDLILFNMINFPEESYELLKVLNEINHSLIMLVISDTEVVNSLLRQNIHIDDYMVNPINIEDLETRILLRYKNKSICETYISMGDIFIDESKREVIEKNKHVNLTPKEFDLLLYLLRNPNIVFKRDTLLDKVWGYGFEGDKRTVDSHIKNLREKIKFCRKNLKTIWGVGYKLHILE